MGNDPCPHCGGYSWHENDGEHIVVRCVCGYLKYICKINGSATILHTQTVSQLLLPRPGTRLSICLGQAAAIWPVEFTTKSLSVTLSEKSSDVANLLMVLMHKGLVEKTEDNRGLPGGSTWKITRRAVKILRL